MASFFETLSAKMAEARATTDEQDAAKAHDDLQEMAAPRFTGSSGASALATIVCEAISKSSKIGTKGMHNVSFRIIGLPKDAITLGTGAYFSRDGLEAILPVMQEDQKIRAAKDARKVEYEARGEEMPDSEKKSTIPKFATGQTISLRLGTTIVAMSTGLTCPEIETITKGKICSVQIRAVLDEPKYPGRPSIRVGNIEVIDTVSDLSPEAFNMRLCAMWLCSDIEKVPVQMRYPQASGSVVAVKTGKELRELKASNLTPETAFMKNATIRIPVFRTVPQPFVLGIMNTGRPIVSMFSPPGLSDDFQGLPGSMVNNVQWNRLYFNIQAELYVRNMSRIPKSGPLDPMELKSELLAIYDRKMRVQFGVTQWQIWIGVKNHAQLFPGMAGFQMICATPATVDCYVSSATAIGALEPEPSPLSLNLTACSGGNDKKLPVEQDELVGQVDLVVGVYNAGFLVDYEAVEGICKAQNAFGLPGLSINVDPKLVKNMRMRQPTTPSAKSTNSLQTNELSTRWPIVNCFEHDEHLESLKAEYDFIAVPNLLKRIAGKFVNGETTAIAKLYLDMFAEARQKIVDAGEIIDDAEIDLAAENALARGFGKLLVLYLKGGSDLPTELEATFNRGTASRADMLLYAVKRDHAKARGVTTRSSSNEIEILSKLSGEFFPPFDCVSFVTRKRTAEEDELEARKRAEPTDDDLAEMDLDGEEELAKQRAATILPGAPAHPPPSPELAAAAADQDSDSREQSPSPMHASTYDD